MLFFLPLVTALPARKYAVKDVMAVHENWRIVPATINHEIHLRIGLAQPNLDVVEARLNAISSPDHVDYGKHMSQEELLDLTRPKQTTYDKVLDWLAEHGLDSKVDHDWISMTIPVRHAEKLLNTKYEMFEHESGHQLIRTRQYSLPSDLFEHIDLVQPTTMIGSLHAHRSHIMPQSLLQTSDPLNVQNTPNSLRSLYKIGSYTAQSPKSAIGIASFLNQSADYDDFNQFIGTYAPQQKGYTFETKSINGGTTMQTSKTDPNDAIEANLDTQFAFSLAYPMNATQFSVGGMPPFKPDLVTPTDTNEPYLDFVNYLQSSSNIPSTISISYGDDEQTVPIEYARKVCSGFMQLGARGVSVLVSSGDFGVGGGGATSPPTNCVSNDGKQTRQFLPAFPASCPWVTTIGATYLDPEVAVFSFGSGGGFSNYFPSPDYQKSAVTGYKPSIPAVYNGLYNASGRGYPDVAAQGDQFQVVVGGTVEAVSGTSASAPTFAGVVALLNDVRLSQGKPTLGFLNPFLYSKGLSGLNDIVVGSNPGCGTPGFLAARGWDAVTGLGTPDFSKLRTLI